MSGLANRCIHVYHQLYNYWQSGISTFGGSLMWELFMEGGLPSTNDLIATSIGGMALGEFFYRTSDLVLDDRATGWSRFGKESLGLLLSPGDKSNEPIIPSTLQLFVIT